MHMALRPVILGRAVPIPVDKPASLFDASVRQWETFVFFFFNDTATTEIYTLSLHDALPIFLVGERLEIAVAVGVLPVLLETDPLHEEGAAIQVADPALRVQQANLRRAAFLLLQRDVLRAERDRKSTRLNSSHSQISYAVFCL